MRAIKTPPSLKWLINKRARLHGELLALQKAQPKQLSLLNESVDLAASYLRLAKFNLFKLLESFKTIPALLKEIEALDTVLGIHEVKINTSLIQPVRSNGFKRCIPYGDLTKSIVECLSDDIDTPKSSSEITYYISVKYGLDANLSNIKEFKVYVGNRLKNICKAGKINRTQTRVGNKDAKWTLV